MVKFYSRQKIKQFIHIHIYTYFSQHAKTKSINLRLYEPLFEKDFSKTFFLILVRMCFLKKMQYFKMLILAVKSFFF